MVWRGKIECNIYINFMVYIITIISNIIEICKIVNLFENVLLYFKYMVLVSWLVVWNVGFSENSFFLFLVGMVYFIF